MQKNPTQGGFTLIETLIYIAIVGMAVSSLIYFSIAVGNARTKSYVVEEVQASTRAALNIIERAVRTAESVDREVSTFGADPGVLVLHVTDVTKEPTTIALSADDGTLTITEGAGEPQLLMSDEVFVSNLVFTDLTGSSTRERIRIEMTADYENASGNSNYTYSQSLQTAVSVRK